MWKYLSLKKIINFFSNVFKHQIQQKKLLIKVLLKLYKSQIIFVNLADPNMVINIELISLEKI